MKGYCALIGSLVAASTVALSSSAATSGDRYLSVSPCANQGKSIGSPMGSSEKGKFAPKFDGLRFIETLITAHR